MAITVSLTGDWLSSIGNKRMTEGTITLDSSYATGGESVTAANLGLGVLDSLILNHGEDGYVFHWDKANATIMAFYADYDAVADGALIEVAATTDLSSVVIEFTAVGK